jgi:hypothetical protein
MKKLYFLAILVLVTLSVSAQTTIDIGTIDGAYTTTFEDELVIDLATTSSTVAAPLLSYANPFMGATFTEAEVSFDVYNYHGTDSIKVLGSMLSFFDAVLGRMYLSNGTYLGFNIGDDNWFDANVIDYGLGTDFLGGNAWRNVKLQFTASGYAVYVDDALAYDNNSSSITINSGPNYDPATIITFLQGAASLVFGTGSWWSDNTRTDGSYWDAQFSYLKNITLTPDFSSGVAEVYVVDEARLIGEEYFSITGAKVATKYSDLKPGLYIKKCRFDNGEYTTEKILKMDEYIR